LRTNNTLFQQNSSKFADNTTPIKMLIETGWLTLGSLQGFQRVYKALVLGDWFSEHKLQIKAAYNFNEAFTQQALIDPTPSVLSPSVYGKDNPYGTGTPYGGDGAVYQARFDFQVQKCESVKLQISDVQTTPGEGLSLSAITLEVGGKSGLFKPNQSKIFGVKR
jgi:hypothetical protein